MSLHDDELFETSDAKAKYLLTVNPEYENDLFKIDSPYSFSSGDEIFLDIRDPSGKCYS